MAVTAPGDVYEQEADAVANAVTGGGVESLAQRQTEEDSVQRQLEEEEEPIQAQPLEEEEEMLQPQPLEEEEEMLQPQLDGAQGFLQRQEELPEEEL